MARTTFEALDWAQAGNELLDRSRTHLSKASSDKVRQLATRVPASVLSGTEGLTVVFAGQYGAGKSTIMKALTGREDIDTGAGITTEAAHTYSWDAVHIIDTPGVHTELRPDHDEITYRCIADADLLVFVVTNELFDSHLARHFRTLAVERDKAHEMMLVVNKMRRCAAGNSPVAQTVIREDLRKVLAPFTPEELHTTFIDALSTLEGKAEPDPEVAAIMNRKSGMEVFTQELNSFIREKGLAGRYSTSLYSLEQVLQEALASESTGDTDVDGLEELLLQRRRALQEAMGRIPHAITGEVQRVSSEIRREGHRVADLINASGDPKDVDRELKATQGKVERLAGQLETSLQGIIAKQMANLDLRIEAIINSELAKELLPRLALRIEGASISPEAMARLKKASDLSTKFGQFLVKNSFNAKAGTLAGMFKLNQYSGTAAHEAVKAIGGFLGKSFKPWEAVKWARGIANAGRVLAVAGAVISFVLLIKEDEDAKNLEKDLREGRTAVRGGFNEAAHAIEAHFDKATGDYLGATLKPQIVAVDGQLQELREMRESRSALFSGLLALLEDNRALIRDLHTTGELDKE
jgi:GTP-binding protein EngB required for normal cell division